MPPKISKRSDIPAFRVMDVMTAAAALEAQGRHIIHMEVGEPGTPTPVRVIDAAERTMRAGRGGYTVALGIPSLRERIARHYGEAYGADVDPKQVIVTTGSSAAFTLAFTSTTAFAGGPVVVEEEPVVEAASPRSGWIVPVVVGLILICAVACGNDDDDNGGG